MSIKEKFNEGVDKIEDFIGETIEDVGEFVDKTLDKIGDAAGKAGNAVDKALDEAGDYVAKKLEHKDDEVPVTPVDPVVPIPVEPAPEIPKVRVEVPIYGSAKNLSAAWNDADNNGWVIQLRIYLDENGKYYTAKAEGDEVESKFYITTIVLIYNDLVPADYIEINPE